MSGTPPIEAVKARLQATFARWTRETTLAQMRADFDEALGGTEAVPCREVEVASPDLPKLREAIDAISGADWSGAGADRRQVVTLTHIDVPTFNRQLVEHGVPVAELVGRGRTLEDLFLELVGGTEI